MGGITIYDVAEMIKASDTDGAIAALKNNPDLTNNSLWETIYEPDYKETETSLLHIVSEQGDRECASLLVTCGASLSKVDGDGKTPEEVATGAVKEMFDIPKQYYRNGQLNGRHFMNDVPTTKELQEYKDNGGWVSPELETVASWDEQLSAKAGTLTDQIYDSSFQKKFDEASPDVIAKIAIEMHENGLVEPENQAAAPDAKAVVNQAPAM